MSQFKRITVVTRYSTYTDVIHSIRRHTYICTDLFVISLILISNSVWPFSLLWSPVAVSQNRLEAASSRPCQTDRLHTQWQCTPDGWGTWCHRWCTSSVPAWGDPLHSESQTQLHHISPHRGTCVSPEPGKGENIHLSNLSRNVKVECLQSISSRKIACTFHAYKIPLYV